MINLIARHTWVIERMFSNTHTAQCNRSLYCPPPPVVVKPANPQSKLRNKCLKQPSLALVRFQLKTACPDVHDRDTLFSQQLMKYPQPALGGTIQVHRSSFFGLSSSCRL